MFHQLNSIFMSIQLQNALFQYEQLIIVQEILLVISGSFSTYPFNFSIDTSNMENIQYI